MVSWVNSSLSLDDLAEEYINQKKSLSQICWDHNIYPGAGGAGAMSAALKGAGYTIRHKYSESTLKRRITRDTLQDRLGISWDELVNWYNARKPLTALCAKHGLAPGRAVIFSRLLSSEGIMTNDPLRGFGFNQKELVKMYTKDKLSMLAIRRKYDLSRNAGTVISAVLQELGIRESVYMWRTEATSYEASDGYVRVQVRDCNKHLTDKKYGSYEMEHRLVVAASIGRPLTRNEWVHHINRDKCDNKLSNLMMIDKNEHKRIHISMDKLIEELFSEGRATLTGDNNYKLVESDDYRRGFNDALESMLETR